MRTMQDRLIEAQERLAQLESALDAATGKLGVPNDPGAHSGIRRTTSARQERQADALTVRALAIYKATETQRKLVAGLTARIRAEERDKKADAAATVDIDSLVAGDYIRYVKFDTSNNWAQVVRVNAKTVTCWAAPGMDQPKIGKDRIRETRKAVS